MPTFDNIITGFKNTSADIGSLYVLKSYIIDNYPFLVNGLKSTSLYGWGLNNSSLFYLSGNRSSPIQILGSTDNSWVSISFGSGIKSDGTLWMWSTGNKAGDNTTTAKSSPVQTIAGGTNWKQVSALATTHAAAVKTDGTLWLWGTNASGQLGDNTTASKSSPIQTLSGGTNWAKVSVANLSTAAIKADGTLWVWGINNVGQIANGGADFISRSSPVQVVGTNWRDVFTTGSSLFALKKDGTLWSWGSNAYGQLGDNTTVDKYSPIQVGAENNWMQIWGSSAIKADGTLWNWGSNVDGALGDNTIISRSSPVQTIAKGTNWKKTAGNAAIKTDGSLWGWGGNTYGNLGDNSITRRSSPVQTIARGNNWKDVVSFGSSILALTDGNY